MVRDVDKIQTHVRNFLPFETTAAAATDSNDVALDKDKDDDNDVIVTLDMECRLGRREWLSRQETTVPMRSKLLDQLRQVSWIELETTFILLSHGDKNCSVSV